VLITHGPPSGVLDKSSVTKESVGCEELRRVLNSGRLNKLKFHIFGHIHGAYGTDAYPQVTFINAATCNERYSPVNPPIVFEVEAE